MPKAAGFSVASKVMLRYEQDRIRRAHKQKLTNMKAGIDNGAPKTYPHLVVRLKRLQKEEEQQSILEHNNRLLLHKITTIMTRQNDMDNWNNYEAKSLNTGYRERMLEKIANENVSMGKRLGNVKPMYDTQKWEDDFKKHNYYLEKRNEETKEYGDNLHHRSRYRQKTMDGTDRSDTSDSRFPIIGIKKKETNTTPNAHNDLRLPAVQQNRKPTDANNIAEFDAKQLFKVAKGLAPPDEIIIKGLARRTHKQRLLTRDKFQQIYELDLASELKQGLGSKWTVLIDALLTPRDLKDCSSIHQYLEDKMFGDIVELLKSREYHEKMELNGIYKTEYGVTMETEIKDKTTGPLQTLLIKLLTEDKCEVNDEESDKDARELMNPEQWTFESSYAKLCSLLDEKSIAHVNATFSSIKPMSRSQDVLNALRKDCDDDTFVDALAALVRSQRDTDAMYAVKLFTHLNPKDPVFVTTLVDRADSDMAGVRKAYKRKYGDDLVEDLRERGPHPTNKVLVDLITSGSRINSPGMANTATHKCDLYWKRRAGVAIKPQAKHKAVKAPPPLKKSESDAHESPLLQRGRRPLLEVKHKHTELNKDDRETENDCVRLHNAIKGVGTDEKALIEVLVNRNNTQRQKIRAKYYDKYNKDLIEELNCELTGDFEEIVLALLRTPAEYDAHCLHAAMDGLGTDEAVLIGILCTRNDKEMSAIKKTYKNEFGETLEKAIAGDTSKAFRQMLLQLMKGARNQGDHRVDVKAARVEAENLLQSVKSGVIDIELLQSALMSHSLDQTREFLHQYNQVAKHSLKEDVAACLSGDDKGGYLGLLSAIEDPVIFYVERLHQALDGVGTDDSTLIRIIASRSEVDLYEIKSVYEEMYERKLRDDVAAECTGDYRNILLALIGR